MENTSCGENCCFVQSGFCNSEKDCPNYTETIWEEASTGKIKTVKDCSPKRTMIEQQRLINSFTGVTASVQVLRDKIDKLESLLLQIINESKIFIAEIDQKKIEAIMFDKEKRG